MYVLLSPLILPFLFSVSAAGIFGGGSSSYVTCASISSAARSCPPPHLVGSAIILLVFTDPTRIQLGL